MELDVLITAQYLQLQKRFSGFQIVDISELTLTQRMTKESKEIECIKGACRIADKGHERALETIGSGITELELSSAIESAQREAGHEGLYFIRQFDFFMGRGPLASGKNLMRIAGKVRSITGIGLSPSIPLGASNRRIAMGEPVVVDIPTHFKGYHCDQSRTYVPGRATETCKMIYGKMKFIADKLIEDLVPGISCGLLYKKAESLAADLDVTSCFMHLGDDSGKVPFIGHGVGLELNEPPLLAKNHDDILKEGMVLALELEMLGPAGEVVKLEDMVHVRKDGAEMLTISSRELQVV
jgi:Xaa-Pro aminopeptidase